MIVVRRSKGAPRILVEGTSEDRYRDKEVVDRLMEDFKGKCYVCEIKPLQSIEVKHLLPHKNGQFPERKYDWNNLFLSCRHCNSVKARAKYDGHIVDCCKRNPETLLDQDLVENRVQATVLTKGDHEANMTAELIEEVFMSDNPPLRSYEADMRLKELQKRMNLLYASLQTYRENPHDAVALRTLRVLLKPESAFAGFTRCYVRKHLNYYPELASSVLDIRKRDCEP